MKKAQPSERFPSDTVGVPAIKIIDEPNKEEYLPERTITPIPTIQTYPHIVPDSSETVAVYDPTQEIVDRLDRIAKAIEESNILARAELRVKGIEP